MTATLTVYDTDGTEAGGAGQGVLAVEQASGEHQGPGQDGSGSCTVAGDTPAALLQPRQIIRLNDGTGDRTAFIPLGKKRRSLEGGDSVIDLSGPGVRWWLHLGQVLPEDGTDDWVGMARERWFGWMASAYTPTGWVAPVSFGTFLSGPWETPRPTNWPASLSEYISISTDPVAGGTDWGAIATYTPGADGEFIPVIAADDEYRLWINGTLILDTIGGGPFQWQEWQQRPLRLRGGVTYTIAIQVRNLERPAGLEATNYTWLQFALAPAGSDGKPRSANQQYAVYHDHTGGTFTLSSTFGETSAAIAWNAAASTVQSTLEAMATVGAGNVTVTGSGTPADPWEVTFGGDLASKHIPLTANGAALTGGTAIEVDEWERGADASAVLRTNVTDWVVKDFTSGVPGLTATHILRTVNDEVRARGAGVFNDITEDFTSSVDTGGNAITDELTFPVSLPADVHRLSVMLEQMGHAIAMAPDLALQCWTTYGTDVSASVALVVGTEGMSDFGCESDELGVRNALFFGTDQGRHEITDGASIAARGRWEDALDLSGYTGEDEAAPVTAQVAEDHATPQRVTSLTITSECAIVPFTDFGMGWIVSATAWDPTGWATADMRVEHIGWTINERSVEWTVEVHD